MPGWRKTRIVATMEQHESQLDSGRPRATFGTYAKTSFSIWSRNFIPFTGIMFVMLAPVLLYTGWLLYLADGSADTLATYQGIMPLLSALLSLLATGVLAYGVVHALAGSPLGFLPARLRGGSRHLFAVLGVGLLSGGIVFIVFVGGTMVLTAFVGIDAMEDPSPGFLFLAAIPAIILLMLWSLAIPVAVIERPGVSASLRRSRELTKGRRTGIFFALVLWGVGGSVIDTVAELALLDNGHVHGYVWTSVISSAVWGGVYATLIAVIYQQIREAREGIGIDALREVFA